MKHAREINYCLTIRRALSGALLLAVAAWSPASSLPLVGRSGHIAPARLPHNPGAPSVPRVDAARCPRSVVYVVSNYTSAISMYDSKNLTAGPCGKITGFRSAQGLFVDSKRNLWVADAFAQKIFEFAPRAKTPVLALGDPYGSPKDPVVDETSGTVYVTEYQNNVNPTTLVEVFANGSTTPTGSLSDPNARNGGYDTVDNQGNLYVTFMTQANKAQVDRWIGGTGTPQNLALQLISAGGIVTTASGALAVCDPYDFRCGIFEPGSTTMSHVFGHMGRRHFPVGRNKPPWLHPQSLALGRSERLAFVATNSVTTWKFPGPADRPNHRPVLEIKVAGGADEGIAVSPASAPGAPY